MGKKTKKSKSRLFSLSIVILQQQQQIFWFCFVQKPEIHHNVLQWR